MSALQTAFRKLPLRWKLITVTVGISTIALVLSSMVMISQGLRDKKAGLTQTLTLTARLISDDSAEALRKGDHDAASGSLLPLIENKAILLACLYGSDGQIFAEYSVSDRTCANGFGPAMRAAAAAAPKTFLDDMRNLVGAVSSTSLTVAYPIKEEGRLLGVLYLQSDLTEWQAFVRAQLTVAGVAILLSALLVVGLTAWLQRTITAPALKLVAAAEEFTKTHDYGLRVAKDTEDEFGMLADAFNGMLEAVRRRAQGLTGSESKVLAAKTAAEKANASASEALAIVKTLVAVVDQGILVADSNARISMANDRVRRLLDIKIGTDFAEFTRARRRQAGETAEEIEAYIRKLAEPFREEDATPDGKVIEIRHIPLPGHGFVRTYTEVAKAGACEPDRLTA